MDTHSSVSCQHAPWRIRLSKRAITAPKDIPNLPEWARDGIMVRTATKLSIKDRIIVALTGNIIVRSWISCENPPGRIETTSDVSSELY